jgi:signal transduction histidine kinase
MSHEIRTPMNGILFYRTLNLKVNSKKTKNISNRKVVKRMLNIINDIINISKVESGQIEVPN